MKVRAAVVGLIPLNSNTIRLYVDIHQEVSDPHGKL